MTELGWRGYIFSRPINGDFVPQRVQNLVIRTYCEKKKRPFLLSATEYYMDDCHMILLGLMRDLAGVSGVVFYTTHMLPHDSKVRGAIYRSIFEAGIELHFALEELSIAKQSDVALIEDLIMVRTLSEAFQSAQDAIGQAQAQD